MTSEEKTPDEMVTSQTVSFSDVVYGFVQEDYTAFTDFPSSEDLDAFLADMEHDCGNILQKTPSALADAMRSTENSDNVLDFTIGDCFFTQKDSVRQQWVRKSDSNVNQTPVLDIELSDSQFLRNCNTVFTV